MSILSFWCVVCGCSIIVYTLHLSSYIHQTGWSSLHDRDARTIETNMTVAVRFFVPLAIVCRCYFFSILLWLCGFDTTSTDWHNTIITHKSLEFTVDCTVYTVLCAFRSQLPHFRLFRNSKVEKFWRFSSGKIILWFFLGSSCLLRLEAHLWKFIVRYIQESTSSKFQYKNTIYGICHQFSKSFAGK